MNLPELADSSAIAKVALFFGVWGLLWLPIAIGTALALNWHPPQPLNDKQKPIFLASLYLIVPFLVGAISRAENLSFSAYGWVWEISMGISPIAGFCLAVLSLALLFGAERILGWVNWQPQPQFQPDDAKGPFKPLPAIASLLSILALALWIGATEELVFRGFVQYHLQQDYPFAISAAIASAIFALSHLIWEVRETLPQLPGLALMGMVLAFTCAGDRGLGLAIGLHAGWIWGITGLQTLGTLTYTRRVPPWVTGIGDQPLAGVLGIAMLLAVAGLLAAVYN